MFLLHHGEDHGDMSARANSIYRAFSPRVEIYSIDESFLDVSNVAADRREALARDLRSTVLTWTGLPTCVGIGPIKTMAKLANHVAKKNPELGAVERELEENTRTPPRQQVSLILNQGSPMWMPSALASAVRAMAQPSLLDSTITGTALRRGRRRARRSNRSCCRRSARATSACRPCSPPYGAAARVDAARYDAPDLDASIGVDPVDGIARVGEGEGRAGALPAPDLEGSLAVDVDDHDVTVLRRQRAIDDGEVAVEQALADHTVAGDPHQEGRGAIGDQKALEVDLLLDEVVRRARLVGAHGAGEQRQGHGRAEADGGDVHAPLRSVRMMNGWW